LPQPRSYYFTADPPNFQRMADDCTALADSVIDFNNFQGINFVFNVNFGCCAWGGAIGLTLDGTNKAWPATWMPPGGLFQSIWAHELGHAFGMPHSANVLGQTYQNAWDVMSKDRHNCGADTDPVLGCVGQHANAFHKDLPGWIPASRKFTQPGTGGTSTITLERLAQPGANGYLMAKVPIPGNANKYYTVEARYRLGYDKKVSNDAVIIHEVDRTRLDDSWTMDSDGNADSSDAGAQWLPGETFTDATNNISIKVDSATASGFVVSITTPGIITTDLIVNDPALNANLSVAGATNWFSFTAPAITYYTVETFNTGTLNDTVMKLYGPNSNTSLIIQNDDIGGGNTMSRINKQLLNIGVYYVAITAKSGTATGTYSIQASAPLLVTRNDNNAAQLGSLSNAIGQAVANDTVLLAPRNGNTINLVQSVTVNKNITIRGQCNPNTGPVYTLNGATAPAGTNGLVLSANVTLSGIKISGFPGQQLKVTGGRSQLSCVVASKAGSP
jgi:hypothetical protein